MGPFLFAAVLLGIERACYVWIARAPDSFRRVSERPSIARLASPVAVVGGLFFAFKVLQFGVFVGWCNVQGNGSLVPADPEAVPLALAAALMGLGQILNLGVFYRLGAVGVFFGDRLGHAVPWCREFPFSWVSHPQYVGTVLTIWGLFLVMRSPQPDWYLLPALETVYYALGAHLETRRAGVDRGDRLDPARLSRWVRLVGSVRGTTADDRPPGSSTGRVVPGRPSPAGSRRS